MKIIIKLIILSILTGQSEFLHKHPAEFYDDDIKIKNKKKRMDNMMIWRLTNQLELKTEQAEVFFPIYRQHMIDLKELNQGQKEITNKIKNDIDDNKAFSKTGVRNILLKYHSLEEKKLDQKKQFIKKVENILNPKQIAILGVFKHKMMNEIKEEIRGYRDFKSYRKKTRKEREGIIK